MSKNVLYKKLNHPIVIQKKDEVQDLISGFLNTSWVDIATIWGEILPIGRSINVSYLKKSSKVTHNITIAYREDVKINYRIIYKNRIFIIDSIINSEEKNDMLDILVQEIES